MPFVISLAYAEYFSEKFSHRNSDQSLYVTKILVVKFLLTKFLFGRNKINSAAAYLIAILLESTHQPKSSITNLVSNK